jgi:glutamine synthetase
VARRPARAGSRDAASGRLARTLGDLRGRFRRDGFGRARAGGAPDDPARQIERLAATGLTAQVASELEFALYHGSYDEGRANGYETLVPTTLARADYTIQAGDVYEGFFSGVRDALAASELGPWTSQVEWGLGQWEINLEYRHPLEMADRHLLFKLAMRTLAANAGMAVTFMARPFADTTGSSRHLHLSLVDGDGRNAFHDAEDGDGISSTLRHAIGGVLQRGP